MLTAQVRGWLLCRELSWKAELLLPSREPWPAERDFRSPDMSLLSVHPSKLC